jgi:hypothetical protein
MIARPARTRERTRRRVVEEIVRWWWWEERSRSLRWPWRSRSVRSWWVDEGCAILTLTDELGDKEVAVVVRRMDVVVGKKGGGG